MLPATVRPTEVAAVHPSPKAPARHPKGRRGTDRASRCRLGSTVVANRDRRVRGSRRDRRVRGSRRDRRVRGSRRDHRVRGSRRDHLARGSRRDHRPVEVAGTTGTTWTPGSTWTPGTAEVTGGPPGGGDRRDHRVHAPAEVRLDHRDRRPDRRVHAAAEVRRDHRDRRPDRRGRHIACPGRTAPRWRRLTPD